MNSTPAILATPSPEELMARPSRLAVTRSHAFGLLVSKADEEEIANAIKPALHQDLELAMGGALNELQPAPPAEVFAMVTTVVRLIGQNWSHANRQEFIGGVAQELADLPGFMVLDALARSRRCVTEGRNLVKWVCDDVDPRANLLRLEVERLTKLVNLAVPAA